MLGLIFAVIVVFMAKAYNEDLWKDTLNYDEHCRIIKIIFLLGGLFGLLLATGISRIVEHIIGVWVK